MTGRSIEVPHVGDIGRALESVGATVRFGCPGLDPQPGNDVPVDALSLRRTVRQTRSVAVRAAGLAYKAITERRKLDRLIDPSGQGAIIVADDRRVVPDLVAIDAARRHGLASVVAPFAVSSIEANMFMRLRSDVAIAKPQSWGPVEMLIATRWPGQARKAPTGERLLFYSKFETLTLAALGLLPRNPWVIGGSGADLICALGADHRNYLLDGGVPEERIAITGQPYTDRLILQRERLAELRVQCIQRYGLDPNKPVAICAVPQYAEHGIIAAERHASLISELFAVLGCAPLSVLLSLHPKSERRTYFSEANRNGLAIAEEAMIDLLPIANVLIATYSSTVRWAIGLGIPAFVIDPVGMNYQLYSDLSGASIFQSFPELERALDDFVGREEYRGTLERAASRGAAQIGKIDGQAGARFASAVQETILRKRAHTQASKAH